MYTNRVCRAIQHLHDINFGQQHVEAHPICMLDLSKWLLVRLRTWNVMDMIGKGPRIHVCMVFDG